MITMKILTENLHTTSNGSHHSVICLTIIVESVRHSHSHAYVQMATMRCAIKVTAIVSLRKTYSHLDFIAMKKITIREAITICMEFIHMNLLIAIVTHMYQEIVIQRHNGFKMHSTRDIDR